MDYIEQGSNCYPIIWRHAGKQETSRCPFCGDTHIHGLAEGSRLTHCTIRVKRGKEIHPKDEITLSNGKVAKRSRGYYVKHY